MTQARPLTGVTAMALAFLYNIPFAILAATCQYPDVLRRHVYPAKGFASVVMVDVTGFNSTRFLNRLIATSWNCADGDRPRRLRLPHSMAGARSYKALTD